MARMMELAGASPVDVLCHILQINPQIIKIKFWGYTGDLPASITEGGESRKWLSRAEALDGETLAEMIDHLPENAELGVGSKVQLASGASVHIPMMDFQTPRGKKGLSLVIERLRMVEVPAGWILETDASYHYYGARLLTEQEWLLFLGNCLLTSILDHMGNYVPVADSRYIGHSLIRGENVLRVSTSSLKTAIPAVVASIY